MESAVSLEQPILSSDNSIKCLSERLKQNVQGFKEIAIFLKKRSTTEEEQAKALQRLAHSLQENTIRADVKQGTCSAMSKLHDLVADHSSTFAKSCGDISDELFEMSKETERTRKGLKDTATKADRTVHEAESAREKAKQRHEVLVDEWDRSQGIESNKKTTFSFKPGRSSLSHKQIEDLRIRLETAEVDWRNKIDIANRLRAELTISIRPDYVRDFIALIRETDASLSLHLNRYARISEDLILGQANIFMPTGTVGGLANVLGRMNDTADLERYLSDCGTSKDVPQFKTPDEHVQITASRENQPFGIMGTTLAQFVENEPSSVPFVVRLCCQAIISRGRDIQGIYRVTGQPSIVQRLRTLLLQGTDIDIFMAAVSQEADVHAAASVIKQFFRDLPDSLIPRDQYQKFISASKMMDEHQRRIALHQAVNDLPDSNYSTLRFFLLHLKQIEAHSERNLMTANNLAIVLGPTLFDKVGINEMSSACIITETLLYHSHLIFDAGD